MFILLWFFFINVHVILKSFCILREALEQWEPSTRSLATLMSQKLLFFFFSPFLLFFVQSHNWLNQKFFCRALENLKKLNFAAWVSLVGAKALCHTIIIFFFKMRKIGRGGIKCHLGCFLLLLKLCLCVDCRGQQWVGVALFDINMQHSSFL